MMSVFRIRMFLGLPDPHPDTLVPGTDPNADPAPGPPSVAKILFLIIKHIFTILKSLINIIY
jgi:hypothetical protein